MRRITKLIAVGALGLAFVTGTGSALAAGPTDAPGQEKAWANCIANIDKQGAKGLEAGGGPKSGTDADNPAPTNCDHFWQVAGYIGNGK